MNRETIFSPCRKYRYTLWREWDCDLLTGCSDDLPNSHRHVQFIGLNPSTADETLDDPNIRRCIGFAKAWGYGALCMTNLFAWRDTTPKAMKLVPKPVGDDNVYHIMEQASNAGLIIAAWGKDGRHLCQGTEVRIALKGIGVTNLHHLGLNSDGTPRHPLYLKATTQPQLWTL